MTPKGIRVSIYQQICHEMNTAAKRRLRSGSTVDQVEIEIQKLSNEGTKELTKHAIAFVILAVLVSNLSDGSLLTIKTSFVEISIPKIYCAFVASLLWFSILHGALLQFQYLTLKAIVRNADSNWKQFSDVETVLSGNNLADLTGPFRNDHFFGLSTPFRFLSGATFLLALALALVPILGAYAQIVSVSARELISPSGIYLARPITVASLALLILPIFYIILFFTPVRIQKNKRTIRWRFLISIFRDRSRRHPQVVRWLQDK